jgi:hypothetical protein
LASVLEVPVEGGTKFRAFIKRRGHPRASKTFDTRAEAEAWSNDLEYRIKYKRGRDASKVKYLTHPFDAPIPETLGATEEDIVARAKSFPLVKISGVYFIVVDGRVHYVGKSNNILGRLAQHAAEGRRCERIAYMECDESDLDALEAFYIKKLKPRGNRAGL